MLWGVFDDGEKVPSNVMEIERRNEKETTNGYAKDAWFQFNVEVRDDASVSSSSTPNSLRREDGPDPVSPDEWLG